MDAKYIKGMLSNPDIAPSASINQWIVSILMFHFTLVHVPGSYHGPDGLSRCRPQPGDQEEMEDDFEDWIDHVNGFIHLINPSPTSLDCITASPPVTTYISESAEAMTNDIIGSKQTESVDHSTLTYNNVPRSVGANKADETLQKVKPWLETLQRPSDITNETYKTFMRYCTEFFIAHDKLWRKNAKGHHKLVVPKDRQLFLMKSAHNDVGHHGFYATHALLSE